MFKLFKYLGYFLSAKALYENPDEVLSEFPIAYVQAWFISSLIFLALITGLLFGFGFYFDILLLKIFGFLFLGLMIVDIVMFTLVIRSIKRIIKRISERARSKFSTLTQQQK